MRIFLLFVFLSSYFNFTSLYTSSNKKYSGFAYDPSSNKTIYTEDFEEVIENGKHVMSSTTVKDASGKIIATRKIDFGKSYVTPNFKLEDLRTGYMEGATVSGDSITLYYRDSHHSKINQKKMLVPLPYVVDGGFNYFIKQKWDDLMKDEIIPFHMAVAAKLDYFTFRARKEKETIIDGKKSVVIKIELDNFILRCLVDPITLTYECNSKRLLVYEGITNIPGDKGKNYVAKVVYPQLGP